MIHAQLMAVATVVALPLLVPVTPAHADGDAGRGAQLYAVCAACHGADGSGSMALRAPPLHGQDDWYLSRQLENFKSGARGSDVKDFAGTQMRPMAMLLQDEQAIADVVAYMGTLEGEKPKATVKGDPEQGKAAYATCAACHGASGEGNKALNAPRLAGQPDWYIVTQINNYKAGLRGTDSRDVYGAQMRPMAMTLATDKAVNDVAAYIATMD